MTGGPGADGRRGDDPVPASGQRPLWHLAELAHWETALRAGAYERSTRGASLADVGFIHASYPEQLPRAAKLVYAKVAEPLVVLEIDPDRLAQAGVEVRVEPGDPQDPGSALFPHLYGPLPVSAVTRTRPAAVEKGWLDLGPWADRA